MQNKKIFVLSIIAVLISLLVSCKTKQQEQQWEYKIVHFDRDDQYDMVSDLAILGEDGWEYAGPLTNNGMNAKFIAFKRPKRASVEE